MSLQVWLPLMGNLNNYGLSDVTTAVSGTTSYANGKIGQGLSCNGSSFWTVTGVTLGAEASIACWTKTSTNGKMSWTLVSTASNKLNLYESSQYALNTGNGNTNLFKDSSGNAINCLHDGAWHHYVVTFGSNIAKLYIDGIYKGTAITFVNPTTTNDKIIRIGGGYNNAHTYDWNGIINDFRVYDHCLSPKEVEEISKGLILNYKLDGNGLNNPNLMLGTMMTASPIANGTNYTDFPLRYYNTSASNCTVSNNQVTIILNSTSNLGIAFIRLASEINFNINEYYTLSCEAKTSRSGAQLSIGTSYYNTSDTGVWRGGANKQSFNALNQWQTFTYSFKPDSNIKAICYCFTATGASGSTDTLEIRHCKLEKGSTATTWTPAPEEFGGTPIVYDVSGYNNNGTITGSLTWSDNSARHNGSQYFKDYTNYISCTLGSFTPDAITMSCWIKGTNKSARGGYHLPLNMHSTNYEISIASSSGKARMGFMIGGTRYVADIGSDILDGQWHMLTNTFNGTTICRYVDGELINSATQSGALTTLDNLGVGQFPGGTTYGNTELYESDVRVYTTALTEKQIKELYETSISIDNNGNIYSREVMEI